MTTPIQTAKPSRVRRSTFAATFAALTLAVTGCQSYGGSDVSRGSVNQASTVKQGVVQSMNPVTIRQDNSIIGAGVGAILGGLAGSELGGGDKAQTAGGIAGAVIGGMAGNAAGAAIGTRPGYSYVIRFDSGEVKEIVQGTDIQMAPGTRVDVFFREDGVSVMPSQAAAPQYRQNQNSY